ncbi:pre-rRNA-processing protein esf1 [Diospyros lotus]|uniref:pre-rRNA-processing protein esf1 n=1 Tax=Diospyros lotus TaxID=55363 RepID=UPI002255D93C|nr:pre-rRNA-processing protein esf1 [Diospyros lotus]
MGSKNKKSKKSIGEEPKNEADPSNRAQNGGNRRGGGKVVITDPRFASVHSDPRFAKLSKHKSKVAIDSRFDRMFTDKSFSSSSARVDKRGKPRKDSASQNALKHYYRLEEEGEKLKRKAQAEDKGTESDQESEESEEELKKPGGQSSNLEPEIESDASESVEEGDEEAGEESDEDSSTDTTVTDDEDVIYSEEDNFVQEEDVAEIDKETCRLAVVNLDWRYVKAVDLYVLLSSFLPKVGQILSVAVYPSEFGLKRMEEEALHGPVGLFDDDKEKNESDDDDDDEIDNEKLRAYELSRLRYYYAVVECDSIATADYLYKTCDGVEFERSSNKLDLRFIPDSMEFKLPPRDVATEAPANYEGLDFHTKALQNSKIHLSWDEDEPQRAKTLKRKFDDDQLAELELREFLASDDGVSDEDDNDDTMEDQSERKHKKEDLYRALLQSGEGSDEDGEEDQDQDMEITFNTGLEDLSKRLLEKKDKKSETVWEAYLRKRREKKKARKHRSKDSSEDESDDSDQEPKQDLDDFFEEPSVQGSKDGKGKSVRKGKKHQETSKEAEASRAELELLLADDREADTGLKGYNLKLKKAKGKRSKEIIDEAKIPTADFDDPRFSALFTSPMYALDPTDPQFKRSVAYARQLAQKQRKGDQELSGKKQEKILPREQAQLHSDDPVTDKNELRPDKSSLKKEKHELSSMVKSVKMKSKQVKVASSSNIPVNREKLRSLARK